MNALKIVTETLRESEVENMAGIFEDRANVCSVEYDQFFRCDPGFLQLSQKV